MSKSYLKNIIKLAIVYASVLLMPFFYLAPGSVSAAPSTGGGSGGSYGNCPTGASTSSGCYSQCANGSGSNNCVTCQQVGQVADKNGNGCVDPTATGTGACNKQNGCDIIGKYIDPAINLLSALVGLVAVISIIIGGIQFSTSAGDPQKTAQAKSHISKAILALFAYAFLYAFLQFIVPGGLFNS